MQHIDKTGKVRIQVPSNGRAEVFGNQIRDGLALIYRSLHGLESAGPSGYDLLNRSGEPVPFPPNCEFADECLISEGMVPIKSGKRFGFMNARGEIVVPLRYIDVEEFREGLAPASVSNPFGLQCYGYIGSDGRWIIDPQLGEASSFSDGLAAVKKSVFSNGKYGYIDSKGKEVISPRFDYAGPFHGKLAAVGIETGDVQAEP